MRSENLEVRRERLAGEAAVRLPDDRVQVLGGDFREVLPSLPEDSVHCCVTSPPYRGLRDYARCGCAQRRHASEAALAMCRTQVPGASGQSSATDPRCQKDPDPDCPACGGTGKIASAERQIGLERTPEAFVAELVSVFREVRLVLRSDGTLWLNLGDSYFGSWANYSGGRRGAGEQRAIQKGSSAQNPVWEGLETYRPAATFPHDTLKPKDLVGIPWRVALALQAAGWWLRQDLIWAKPNPMTESVTDRCTKAHEYLFLLSKSENYYYDQGAIKERAERGTAGSRFDAGKTAEHQLGRASLLEREESEWRNKRSVWTVSTTPYKEAHFATFPPALITPCILAGCPPGGTVLDPFGGSGTTGQVALELGRRAVLIELNPQYQELIATRCTTTPGLGL